MDNPKVPERWRDNNLWRYDDRDKIKAELFAAEHALSLADRLISFGAAILPHDQKVLRGLKDEYREAKLKVRRQ